MKRTLAVGLLVCACGRGGDAEPAAPPPPPDVPAASTPDAVPPPHPPPAQPSHPSKGAIARPDDACGAADPRGRKCAAYAACALSSDCQSGLCGPKGICQIAPSCTGSAGTLECGPDADEDCCTSLPVPGGTYQRYSSPTLPATVSPYKLDKFEITVGRLRAYFDAVGGNPQGSPPAVGSGARPGVPASGWRASFDVRLPRSWAEIDARLGAAGCAIGGDNTDGGAATWTHAPGPYEHLPANCIDWYTLFAFCVWDGGRLPTDAEWGFAVQGGSEQRIYAWGDDTPVWNVDNDLVATSLLDSADGFDKYTVGTPFRAQDPVTGNVIDGPAHIARPGAKSGRGKWGHADLNGNMLEYMLDSAPIPDGACNDCVLTDWPDPPTDEIGLYPPDWVVQTPDGATYPDGMRVLRGGSVDPHPLQNNFYYIYRVERTYADAGGRCARD